METLKNKRHLTKDRLVIDGRMFTAGPTENNVRDASALLDLSATCEHSDSNTILFLGLHSIYSNMIAVNINIENVQYTSAEQYIQAEKAYMFGDDISHHKIMREQNLYKIKKIGSHVKKFSQNITLHENLLSTGDTKIAESSTNTFWGRLLVCISMIGMHWTVDTGVTVGVP